MSEYKIRVISTLTGLALGFGLLVVNQPEAKVMKPIPVVQLDGWDKPLLPYTRKDMIRLCQVDPECYILAEAVVYEARSEPMIGQYAVASVILNRVDSKRFPNTIRGVVHQPYQFEYVPNKHLQNPTNQSWDKAKVVAFELINGLHQRVTNSDHYLNPKVVKRMPRWTRVYPYQLTIGDHDFYVSTL